VRLYLEILSASVQHEMVQTLAKLILLNTHVTALASEHAYM
jgi:hypothetical protein